MSVDLAIVVVSHNTRELLRRCLDSLLASLNGDTHFAMTIVVVDNESRDGTVEMVRADFPAVRLIALDVNRGFAGANNIALRSVNASHVLLLNPDTEVLGDALGALVRFMNGNPRVGVAGGRLLNPDLTFQHSCFRFPTLAMTFLDFFPINHRLTESRVNGRYRRSAYSKPFSIDHPLGACMIVRREVIEQVGAFDEGFFMYCEEVDWCFRIRQAGWDIRYCPTAQIIHHVAASTRQQAGPMLIQLHRSRDRLYRKHYPPGFAWVAHQIVRLGMGAASRRAKREWVSGEITAEELKRRLEIYAEIAG